MTNPEEDFTSRGWLVAAATLAVLIVISFIPPLNAGGVRLRRASIISDLITFSADSELTEALAEAAPEINVDEFEVDLEHMLYGMHGDIIHVVSAVGTAGSQVIGGDVAVNSRKIYARYDIIMINRETGDPFHW